MYAESPGTAKKVKLPKIRSEPGIDHNEMIQLLARAGYIVRNLNAE